jgi:PTH2 family peptidyl-tRNA hydrolase
MESEERKPKQVIVVRSDLKMQRGKEISQGAHASMSFITKRLRLAPAPDLGPEGTVFEVVLSDVEKEWLFNGRFTKITVKVDSEQALDEIYAQAKAAGLETHLIIDSGLTVFHGVPTKTCLAIGPDWSENIDPITSGLTLR